MSATKLTKEEAAKLLDYRRNLIVNTVRMKDTDRIPWIFSDGPWDAHDAGYTIEQEINDPHILLESVLYNQREYDFDSHMTPTQRNPMWIAQPFGQSTSGYKIDDETGMLHVDDVAHVYPEHYDIFLENPTKFWWSCFMATKYPNLKAMKPSDLREVFRRQNVQQQVHAETFERLGNEYGVPGLFYKAQFASPFVEQAFDWFRGIKGTTQDLHRIPDKMEECAKLYHEVYNKPALEAVKKHQLPNDPMRTVDLTTTMLSQTFMNRKQIEKYLWPYYEEFFNAVVEADATMLIFSEGSIKPYWPYLKNIPAGHVFIHLEQDDIYESVEALPNIVFGGGMSTSLLGRGTPDECAARAEQLINDLKGHIILSEDKIMTYPEDARPENLKAVTEVVHASARK